jgi:HK97 family phage major capsid protein
MELELKTALEGVNAGVAAVKASTEEIKSSYGKLQRQVDAIDHKMSTVPAGGAEAQPSYAKALEESDEIQRILKNKRGSASIRFSGKYAHEILQRKSVITETVSGSIGSDTGTPVGVATTGVLQIQRIPGITMEARQTLKIRDVLYARPTTFAVVDFVKVSTPMSIASPVAEGSLKPENQMNLSSSSERVKTIATWIPASRQILDDMPELMGFLDSSLGYYVNLEEELQLLSGDNSGEDLHGIIPQAAAFNSGLLPSAAKGWTKIDVIATAIRQIDAAKELSPTFVVVHTNDWWDIRLTKDGFGRYILGDPQSTVRPSIFGLDVVPTTSIAQGTFLVGSGSPVASEIRDNMELVVEISTEHQDYFVRNLVAVRAEKRLAMVVKRANSYVSGTFSTSP